MSPNEKAAQARQPGTAGSSTLDHEEAVVRLWKKNRIYDGVVGIYLYWVRRFRAYCRRRHLEETSQLLHDALRLYLHGYVGSLTKAPVCQCSSFVEQHVYHARVWSVCALQAPVSQ